MPSTSPVESITITNYLGSQPLLETVQVIYEDDTPFLILKTGLDHQTEVEIPAWWLEPDDEDPNFTVTRIGDHIMPSRASTNATRSRRDSQAEIQSFPVTVLGVSKNANGRLFNVAVEITEDLNSALDDATHGKITDPGKNLKYMDMGDWTEGDTAFLVQGFDKLSDAEVDLVADIQIGDTVTVYLKEGNGGKVYVNLSIKDLKADGGQTEAAPRGGRGSRGRGNAESAPTTRRGRGNTAGNRSTGASTKQCHYSSFDSNVMEANMEVYLEQTFKVFERVMDQLQLSYDNDEHLSIAAQITNGAVNAGVRQLTISQ